MAKPMKAELLKKGSEWETTGGFTGFPPLWKPEKVGETIVGVPIEIKSNLFGKGKKAKMVHNINFLLRETNSTSFFTGSKRKKNIKRVDVAIGDLISIPASAKLRGEESVYVEKGKKAVLSKLSLKLETKSMAMKIVFNGRIDVGSGNKMKDFIVQIPKGFTKK